MGLAPRPPRRIDISRGEMSRAYGTGQVLDSPVASEWRGQRVGGWEGGLFVVWGVDVE